MISLITLRYLGVNNHLQTIDREEEGLTFTSIGVIIQTALHSEILIPWSRVMDVSSTERGTLRGLVR